MRLWLVLMPLITILYWFLFIRFDPMPVFGLGDYRNKGEKWTKMLAVVTFVLFVANVLLLTRSGLICPF